MTLDEIRKLIDEATPGDWKAVEYAKAWLIEAEGLNWIRAVGSAAEADARFCAAARTLMPALLDAVAAAKDLHLHARECVGEAEQFYNAEAEFQVSLAALEAIKLP